MRGVRRRPGNERCLKGALLSACEGTRPGAAERSEAPPGRVSGGASAARTAEHRKNPE
ncbi:MAG: hypothetical protein WBZ29_11955 [Methanocella sp.]